MRPYGFAESSSSTGPLSRNGTFQGEWGAVKHSEGGGYTTQRSQSGWVS